MKHCTWPLEGGADCGKPLAPGKDYCEEHAAEARVWDEEMREQYQIKKEWERHAHEGDESPPWKQPPDPQETIAHLIHENAQLRTLLAAMLPDAWWPSHNDRTGAPEDCCVFCQQPAPDDLPQEEAVAAIAHDEDCPIVKARRLLESAQPGA